MQILITDQEVTMNPPMSANAAMNTLLSVLYHMFQSTINDAPENVQDELKEHLYDSFNSAASEFLARLIPDKELTAEAIMAMENQILDSIQPSNLGSLTPEIILEKDEE